MNQDDYLETDVDLSVLYAQTEVEEEDFETYAEQFVGLDEMS